MPQDLCLYLFQRHSAFVVNCNRLSYVYLDLLQTFKVNMRLVTLNSFTGRNNMNISLAYTLNLQLGCEIIYRVVWSTFFVHFQYFQYINRDSLHQLPQKRIKRQKEVPLSIILDPYKIHKHVIYRISKAKKKKLIFSKKKK